MNYSRTVLWLGLGLIILNLVKHWSVVHSTIFTKGSASQAPADSGSGVSSINPITNPWLFLLPGLTSNPNPNPTQTPTTAVV